MKKYIYIAVLLVILVAAFLVFKPEKEIYQFTGNTLAYSEDRGKTSYEVLDSWEEQGIEIRKIKFKSRHFQDQEVYIYGLIYLPDKENAPGFVFLPAGEATKDSRKKLLIELAKEGYASLAIDQRGVGETAGTFLWVQQDYAVFDKGYEPIQHLMVYDTLRSFDVLREVEEIDKNKLGFVGESMGGRYAIIASSLEKQDKGAIIISSAGFNVPLNPLQEGNSYLVSIDPDHYIENVNYLMMLHGKNDEVVPLQNAQVTFDKAREPKEFYTFECEHGYCDEMYEKIVEGLNDILKK